MRFGNCHSCSTHQINGLKGTISITILLKNNSLALISPIVVFSIETKDPNTFSLTIVDATCVTIAEFGVKA
jgi:hypothetical protein